MKQIARTIRHAQAQIVHALPLRERLPNSAVCVVVVGVVIVLHKVPDEKLALTLSLKEESQTERVERRPGEGVCEVHDEGATGRERWEKRHGQCIADYEDKHEVGRPKITVVSEFAQDIQRENQRTEASQCYAVVQYRSGNIC